MKRIPLLGLLLLAFACGLHAQAVDATVCAILKNPASFNGKIVTVKGTVVVGLDQFIVKDGDCGLPVNGIWLAFPPGTKAKAGPIAVVELQPAHNFAGKFTPVTRTPVTLEKNKDFKTFDNALSQMHEKEPGLCLDCSKNDVTATITGRLDGVADATLQRDAAGKIVGLGGFGNMNAYAARLVIQSVSGVSVHGIDFSSSDSVVKGEALSYGDTYNAPDPTGVAEKMASAMGADAGAVSIQKDADIFKGGNHDGVFSVMGNANEVVPAYDTVSTADSPDGVIYNCRFNVDKLLPTDQAAAVLHIGRHINDIRSETVNEIATPYTLENNAWVITAASVARMGEKFLTLPGGYLFFSATWEPADRTGKMTAALSDYLTKVAAFDR